MDSAYPPRYVNLPTREVYNSDLSDAVFRTLAQIRGLAYRFGGQRTPALRLGDLAAMRHVARATAWKHLTELRERGIVQTEPIENHTFVIHLLPGEPDQATQAGGEATSNGDRDDGHAATAAEHLAAEFPLRWGLGAALPVVERADAGLAEHKRFLPSDHGEHSPPDTQTAAVRDDTACRPADLPVPSPGPPRREKPAPKRVKNKTPRFKNEMLCFKDEMQCFKNETQDHVVVVKDHDSKQEEDLKQQHEHERAIRKNDCENESGFDATLRDLAEVLVEYGVRASVAERQARRLLEECGVDVCARQRQAFERRCELARAGPRGLSNPVGLLLNSIRGDWSLPAAAGERRAAHWYTDEEFETFFEH